MALVIGEIDLVRALGIAGVSSAVATVPGDPAGYSKYVVDRVPWFHPLEEPERMIASLIAWASDQEDRPVLFYNGDHDLLLVSRHRDALAPHLLFVVARPDLVEDLVDKDRFAGLARRLDLPVPPNLRVDPGSDEPPAVDYPIVVKPLMHRHEIWNPMSGGAKALRVDDAAALRRVWPRLAGQGPVILQRLIEGPESRIESYHVYVGGGGDIVCEFTGRKLRTHPKEFGDTTALEITAAADVVETGRDIVGRLELTGVAKLDFKRDADGRLWLLEVNPRFNLWHHAGAVAGANIPDAVYRDLTGRRRRACVSVERRITWCHPTRDFRAARLDGIPLATWARWAWATEAKWGLSMRDPMPFVRGVLVRRLRGKVGR